MKTKMLEASTGAKWHQIQRGLYSSGTWNSVDSWTLWSAGYMWGHMTLHIHPTYNKRRMWDATRSNNKTNFQFCVRALPMYRGSMWLFSKYKKKKLCHPLSIKWSFPQLGHWPLLFKQRKNREENTYPRAHNHVELYINSATYRRKEKGRVQDYKVANMASHTACLVYTVGMECCSLLQFQVSDNTPLGLLKF